MKVRFRRFVIVGFSLLFAFSSTAFAWPFGNKNKAEKPTSSSAPSPQKVQASPSQRQASVTSNKAMTQEDNFFDEDENETTEVPSLPQLPQIPKVNVSVLPQVPQVKYPSVAKQPVSVPGASVPGIDPDIERIQKQIQEIMKINESLKTSFSGQAAEIQKISDQAKIHGQILKELDASKKTAQEAGAEKYLNQEKLRLIREETEKNQKYLQELNSKKEASVSSSAKPSSLIPVESTKKV